MTFLKVGTVVATLCVTALSSCAPEPPILAQTGDIDVFAQRVLNRLQPVSIAESREYCGYIYQTAEGALAATAPRAGQEDFCDLLPPGQTVLASYHTHGSYSVFYDNEVPSLDDVTGDIDAGIDGYLSTPGGRLWLVDHKAQIARQLCNPKCMATDPRDNPMVSGFIPQSFTLKELSARFE